MWQKKDKILKVVVYTEKRMQGLCCAKEYETDSQDCRHKKNLN